MSKNMSGTSGSYGVRLRNLQSQYRTDRAMFFGSILDMENELAKFVDIVPFTFKNPVNIEELADDNGYLLDPNIPENTWLESLSRETGLDCRMIVGFRSVKELGLFTWQVVVAEGGKPVTYEMKVWIIPVEDDK